MNAEDGHRNRRYFFLRAEVEKYVVGVDGDIDFVQSDDTRAFVTTDRMPRALQVSVWGGGLWVCLVGSMQLGMSLMWLYC